jgi:hypothetical protein
VERESGTKLRHGRMSGTRWPRPSSTGPPPICPVTLSEPGWSSSGAPQRPVSAWERGGGRAVADVDDRGARASKDPSPRSASAAPPSAASAEGRPDSGRGSLAVEVERALGDVGRARRSGLRPAQGETAALASRPRDGASREGSGRCPRSETGVRQRGTARGRGAGRAPSTVSSPARGFDRVDITPSQRRARARVGSVGAPF